MRTIAKAFIEGEISPVLLSLWEKRRVLKGRPTLLRRFNEREDLASLVLSSTIVSAAISYLVSYWIGMVVFLPGIGSALYLIYRAESVAKEFVRDCKRLRYYCSTCLPVENEEYLRQTAKRVLVSKALAAKRAHGLRIFDEEEKFRKDLADIYDTCVLFDLVPSDPNEGYREIFDEVDSLNEVEPSPR